MHNLCAFDFLSKNYFYQKLFPNCCDKFDYLRSIVYLSCFSNKAVHNLFFYRICYEADIWSGGTSIQRQKIVRNRIMNFGFIVWKFVQKCRQNCKNIQNFGHNLQYFQIKKIQKSVLNFPSEFCSKDA